MSFIQRVAGELGSAIGTFKRSLAKVARSLRPEFLTAWAESEKWKGGDYIADQAQKRAMLNSWVYTATQLIMRESSAGEFEVVENQGDDEPRVIPNHALTRLIRRPNPHIGRAFLWQYTIAWLQLDGNAYWFIVLDDNGQPAELWPMPARDVQVFPGDKDRFIDYYEYTANGRIYRIPAEYIVHFRLPNPFDIFRGLSPLAAAILAADADTAMARWNGAFFGRDNVMPSAIINLSSGDPNLEINSTDVAALKQDLRSGYQASARKTAITSAYKVDVALLGWSSKDMDFIAGRQFTKEEIYSVYGIPGGLMDKNATEANATTADKIFKEKTIWPTLVLLAEQITTELVCPYYGEHFESRFKDIRPADRQMDLQELDRAKGALTVNEVRQKYFNEKPLADKRGEQLYGGTSSAPALPGFGQFGQPGQAFGDGPIIDSTAREIQPGQPQANQFQAAQLQAGQIQSGGSQPRMLPAPQPDLARRAAADLRRWREKSLRALRQAKSTAVPFQSDVIPLDIASHVRSLLPVATSPEQVKLIFSFADEACTKASWRPWSTFENRLYEAIFGALRREAERLSDLAEEKPESLSDPQSWTTHEAELDNALTPLLTNLAEFGVQQVQQQMGAGEAPTVNWSLVNQDAVEYARSQAAHLVRQVTTTTRERIRETLATWVEAGSPKADLVSRIAEIVGNEARAAVISSTESTNIFAEANSRAWQVAGYGEVLFKPAAHVGCRCYLQPAQLPDGSKGIIWNSAEDAATCRQTLETPWGRVDGCRDLHGVVVSDGPYLGKRIR